VSVYGSPALYFVLQNEAEKYLFEGDDTMPKMKTNRGAAKRFKTTGTGKVARSKAFTSHILTKKSTKRKRNLRKDDLVNATDLKGIKRLIPYM
jgi:large subunit ribosomal protein L35